MEDNLKKLIGQTYTFPDGDSITIKEIKVRDENINWVTYYTQRGPGIPQKLMMTYSEFNNNFGHLFNLDDNP